MSAISVSSCTTYLHCSLFLAEVPVAKVKPLVVRVPSPPPPPRNEAASPGPDYLFGLDDVLGDFPENQFEVPLEEEDSVYTEFTPNSHASQATPTLPSPSPPLPSPSPALPSPSPPLPSSSPVGSPAVPAPGTPIRGLFTMVGSSPARIPRVGRDLR